MLVIQELYGDPLAAGTPGLGVTPFVAEPDAASCEGSQGEGSAREELDMTQTLSA